MDQDGPTLPLPNQPHQPVGEAETMPPEAWDGTNNQLARFSIGPYRLLTQLGAGGMGEVWVAEQTEPVKRQVALKLTKSGIGSKEIADLPDNVAKNIPEILAQVADLFSQMDQAEASARWKQHRFPPNVPDNP